MLSHHLTVAYPWAGQLLTCPTCPGSPGVPLDLGARSPGAQVLLPVMVLWFSALIPGAWGVGGVKGLTSVWLLFLFGICKSA